MEYPCGCRTGIGRRAGFYYCPLHKAAPEMYEALKAIKEGKGRFSLDHLKHAENTIENMKQIAIDALAKVEVK